MPFYLHIILCLLNGSPKSSWLWCKRDLSPSSDWSPYMIWGSESFVTSYTCTKIAWCPASCPSKFSTSDSTSKDPPRYLSRERKLSQKSKLLRDACQRTVQVNTQAQVLHKQTIEKTINLKAGKRNYFSTCQFSVCSTTRMSNCVNNYSLLIHFLTMKDMWNIINHRQNGKISIRNHLLDSPSSSFNAFLNWWVLRKLGFVNRECQHNPKMMRAQQPERTCQNSFARSSGPQDVFPILLHACKYKIKSKTRQNNECHYNNRSKPN